MTETAPNKTLPSSAGIRPVAKSGGQGSSITPTHPVKKILETYSLAAERSLLGPGPSPSEVSAYSKYYQGYHGYAHSVSMRSTPTYKLPPDVELSKTTSPEDSLPPSSSKMDDDSLEDLSMDRQKRSSGGGSLHHSRRDSMDRIKDQSPSIRASPQQQLQRDHLAEDLKPQNGLATLSRVDGSRERHASSQLEQQQQQRAKSCDSSHSSGSSSGRHLTGEMIRQLQERGKGSNVLPGGVTPAATSTAAAAVVQHHQHILQMQAAAAYERALKEKSYLRQDTNHRPAVVPPPPAPAFKTPSTSGPVFTARDRSQSDLEETRLAGKDISCFIVGGERRLCLPQILNSVLDQISLPAIHSACDELQIYCSTCTHHQLEKLKLAKIIPLTASQCGLITKSDAERLCSILLDRTPPLASLSGFHAKSSPFSFRVQHFCFGECSGILLPEAYTSPTARCIECLVCEGIFCPQKFVCHSHKNKENRTCHWGFDSANWRSYLLLADDYTQAEKDKLAKGFADFKARYTSAKRKQSEPSSSSSSHHHHGGHAHHPPSNGGNGTSHSKSDEVARAPHFSDQEGVPPPPKKARLPDPPGALPLPPPPAGADPATYGMFLYQSWAAAKMGGAGGPMQTAAAAAAWSAHMAQAIKDGKPPLPFPPGPPSSPSTRLVVKPGLALPPPPAGAPVPPPAQSRIEPRPFQHSIKSSPISESESPSHLHDSSPSSGDNLSPTAIAGSSSLHPGATRRTSGSSSTTSRPSLAEDIHSIRLSLEGASSTAREKILKILERLTARLALAETERDGALGQLKALQKRFDQLEDELHKKRAELREALRQDVVATVVSPPQPPPVRTNGNSRLRELPPPVVGHHRSAVTLELLSEATDLRRLPVRHLAEDIDDVESSCNDEYVVGSTGYARRSSSSPPPLMLNTSSTTSVSATTTSDITQPLALRRKTFTSLPKMDMKSPARIIEEKELRAVGSSAVSDPESGGSIKLRQSSIEGVGSASTGRSRSRSVSPGSPPSVGTVHSDRATSPNSDIQRTTVTTLLQRRRSGTPASTKSKEAEYLQERFLTLEAELRSLREELIRRPPAENKNSRPSIEDVDTKTLSTPTNGGKSSNGVSKCESVDEKTEEDVDMSTDVKTELEDVDKQNPEVNGDEVNVDDVDKEKENK